MWLAEGSINVCRGVSCAGRTVGVHRGQSTRLQQTRGEEPSRHGGSAVRRLIEGCQALWMTSGLRMHDYVGVDGYRDKGAGHDADPSSQGCRIQARDTRSPR